MGPLQVWPMVCGCRGSKNVTYRQLLYIFEMLSYRDLMMVMLVCSRWREIGEIPRLWSSFPVIVNSRNMSVIPEILSIRRMQGLKKLMIETKLSEKVSQTIVRHPGLGEFEMSQRNDEQTIISVIKVICSKVCQGIILKLNNKNISVIDAVLLVGAFTKLETLEISNTKLTQQQIVAILTVVSEGRKMTKLDINSNNMSGVDPELLAKTVTKTKIFNVGDTNLTQQQAEAILTAVSEAKTVMELDIAFNNLSGVDEGLLAKAVTNLKTLNVSRSKLTQRQIVTILTSLIKGNTLHIGMNDLSRVDPGLLASRVTKLEVLDVHDTELSQLQVFAIIHAVSVSKKINELYIAENDLSEVDPGLLTKAVTKLVRLDVQNTKLTQQQNEAILNTLNTGSKMEKLYIGYRDMPGVYTSQLPKAVIRFPW